MTDAYGRSLSARSTRTGPGSRGGRWHDPEYRRAYQRAWRAAHPEYREREALRLARKRAQERGDDPARILVAPTFPRPLPVTTARCSCDCGCSNEVPVVACGMCLSGLHEDAS
jgi:hypothetical protein